MGRTNSRMVCLECSSVPPYFMFRKCVPANQTDQYVSDPNNHRCAFLLPLTIELIDTSMAHCYFLSHDCLEERVEQPLCHPRIESRSAILSKFKTRCSRPEKTEGS